MRARKKPFDVWAGCKSQAARGVAWACVGSGDAIEPERGATGKAVLWSVKFV